ncbi:MAG: beta-galactosidase trimerization domain-containing protein, partial [Phycisphaerae bacterium]
VRRIERQSRKLVGVRWMHDGVVIYYSHPSIQVSWFIDCQLHKRTWINRSSSMNGKLASTVGTFWAWVKLLEDAGLQYNFIGYADLLEHGLDPSQYKVLILPRVLALSDAEAEAITDYVRRGGVVLADHMTGLFDQHGKARKRAALDELFGIASRPPATSATLFGGTCLAELDPEKYWNKTFIDAGKDIRPRCKRARGMVVAERELDCFAERRTGAGWAVHMNTSIMEYAGLRMSDYEAASRYRQPVVQYLVRAGLKPWVHLSVEGRRPDITEATYWVRDGRVYVFVVKNPTKFASEFGETKTEGVSSRQVQLTVRFETPKRDVRDELTGRSVGAGQRFTVPWRMDEVALLSLAR